MLVLAVAWWLFVLSVSASAAPVASYAVSGTCVTGDDVFDFTPATGNDFFTLDVGPAIALDVRYVSDDSLLHAGSYYAQGAFVPHAAIYVACAADGAYSFNLDLAASLFDAFGHAGQVETTDAMQAASAFFGGMFGTFVAAAVALVAIIALPVVVIRSGLRLAVRALGRLRPR